MKNCDETRSTTNNREMGDVRLYNDNVKMKKCLLDDLVRFKTEEKLLIK